MAMKHSLFSANGLEEQAVLLSTCDIFHIVLYKAEL